MTQIYDLIIIGGGQAGLAAGRLAHVRGLNYLILEASDTVGSAWRERYDSLTLFTPRAYSGLPDLPFPGDNDGYPTGAEVFAYLQDYAKRFTLNVALNQEVQTATHVGGIFTVATSTSVFMSRVMIVATGPFQTPRLPPWAEPAGGVLQLHSSAYKNPSQVNGRTVLVVGGGNSGAQIAEELAAHHDVDIAVSTPLRFMPARILGKSIFWWLHALGVLNAPAKSVKAKILRRRGDPVIGTSLKPFLKCGAVRVRPEATAMNDGAITFADETTGRYDAIIYSTGYSADYGWMQIPQSLGRDNLPVHRGGRSTAVSGLYFLGLGWLRSRNSALLGGVGNDAVAVVDHIFEIVAAAGAREPL